MRQRFEEIFRRYYNPLCNYAYQMVRDYHRAEDLVQDLFLQLWENKRLDAIEEPENFLIRSTKFKCIDHLRSRHVQRIKTVDCIEIEPHISEEQLEEEDIGPLLHYFAAKLPQKMREVFLLSRTSGLSYAEIAKHLNISPKTVENQMGSALKKMKALLKAHRILNLL